MKKSKATPTPVQELDTRLQTLLGKKLLAFRAGASQQILNQLDAMITETQLDLYTENELEQHRAKDDDGEQWIV